MELFSSAARASCSLPVGSAAQRIRQLSGRRERGLLPALAVLDPDLQGVAVELDRLGPPSRAGKVACSVPVITATSPYIRTCRSSLRVISRGYFAMLLRKDSRSSVWPPVCV